MSKKVNFGTINAKSMVYFSTFHCSFQTLKALRNEYKSGMEKLQAEEAKILENRTHDIENGMPEEEAAHKWSLEETYRKMRILKAWFDKESKPHNEAKKNSLAILPDNLYLSYILAMQKGDLSAKGTLTIHKKKSSEEYKLDKSFKGYILEFLEDIGCKGQDNDTALSKFVQIMSVRTSGMIKCSSGEDFIKVKTASSFNELFMLAFLQYVIIEKGVVTVNNDNTLSMTVYEEV